MAGSQNDLVIWSFGALYERSLVQPAARYISQYIGTREVADEVWLVSFMDYDPGLFDETENRVEPVGNNLSGAHYSLLFVGATPRLDYFTHSGLPEPCM